MDTMLADIPDAPHGGLSPLPGEPLTGGRRGQIEATNALVDAIRVGTLDRGDVREGLRSGLGEELPGITPAELGAVLARHIREGSERAQSRAMECAVRLYQVCGEEVAALRTLIGADTGPAVAVQVNTAVSLGASGLSPEAVRILNAAARHPAVWEAYSAAMEREGEQAK